MEDKRDIICIIYNLVYNMVQLWEIRAGGRSPGRRKDDEQERVEQIFIWRKNNNNLCVKFGTKPTGLGDFPSTVQSNFSPINNRIKGEKGDPLDWSGR
jgi:hypothetical protein